MDAGTMAGATTINCPSGYSTNYDPTQCCDSGSNGAPPLCMPYPPQCTLTSDCPSPLVCVGGQCQPMCDSGYGWYAPLCCNNPAPPLVQNCYAPDGWPPAGSVNWLAIGLAGAAVVGLVYVVAHEERLI